MYSWRQRADTTVVDEPLYAYYLNETGRHHPGRDEILLSQNTDIDSVINEVVLAPYETPVVFFKQMAKHLHGIDQALVSDVFYGRCRNVLLTRDPFDMLTSFQVNVPDTTVADTGFIELVDILETSVAQGDEPIVLDSKLLLMNPEPVLRELCRRLNVSFDPAMLSWPPGPKPEDGVWSVHWYDRVHASSGWAPWQPKQATLLPHLQSVLDEVEPLYQRLQPYCITAD